MPAVTVPIECMSDTQLVAVARQVPEVHEAVLADVARRRGRRQPRARRRAALARAPPLHPAQERCATSVNVNLPFYDILRKFV